MVLRPIYQMRGLLPILPFPQQGQGPLLLYLSLGPRERPTADIRAQLAPPSVYPLQTLLFWSLLTLFLASPTRKLGRFSKAASVRAVERETDGWTEPLTAWQLDHVHSDISPVGDISHWSLIQTPDPHT